MSRFRIWRHDTETAFADVEAQDEEHAFRLVENGDDQLIWTGARYNAEYEVDQLEDSADPFQRDSTGQAIGYLENDPMTTEF